MGDGDVDDGDDDDGDDDDGDDDDDEEEEEDNCGQFKLRDKHWGGLRVYYPP